MTDSFAGQPIQVAQAATPVGEVAELTGDVVITRATGEQVQATVGTEVFQNDTFETSADGGVGITFNDDSAFSLGSDARLTIDQFVYNPAGDSGMAMNLVQGAFSFVSGQIAKSGDNNMTIQTPTATIGVRGTAGAGDEDEAVLLPEPGQPLGEMTVTTQGGSVTLSTINAYTNTSNPLAPPTTPAFRPFEQIQSQFGTAIRELPGYTPSGPSTEQEDSGDAGDGDGQEDQEGDEQVEEGAEQDGDGGESGEGEGEIQDTGEADLDEGPLEGDGPDEESDLGEGPDTGLPPLIGPLAGPPIGPDGPIFGGPEDILGGPEDILGGPGEDLLGGDPFGGPEDLFGDPFDDPFGDEFDPGSIIEDGDEDAPSFQNILIDDANASDPIFLSDAVIETFEINVSGTTFLSVNGNAIGDSFVDLGGAGNIEVKLEDPGPHIVLVNDIDTLSFVPAQDNNGHSIGVAGTEALTIAGTGSFSGVLFDDGTGTGNIVNIGSGFGFANISVNLGGGIDTLIVNATSGSQVDLIGVENVQGTGADDDFNVLDTLLAGINDDSTEAEIDGGGGNDKVTLLSGGNNILDVKNVEEVVGGGGIDKISLIGGGANTVSIVDIDEVVGGGGVDTVSVGAGSTVGATFNLRGGGDVATGAVGIGDQFQISIVGHASIGLGERITNFESGTDKLDLSGISGIGTVTFNGDAGFIGSGSSSASFQDSVSNLLQVDTDGDGNADIEVTLDGVTAAGFSQSDIIDATPPVST